MQHTVVVQAHISSPTCVELAQSVSDIGGGVEAFLRLASTQNVDQRESVLPSLQRLLPGTRSKTDIDQQIHQELDFGEIDETALLGFQRISLSCG